MRLSFYQSIFVLIVYLLTSTYPQQAFAYNIGEPTLQVGWFTATQGKGQHVDINGLIGDNFKVTKSSDQNLLLGLGYYFKALSKRRADILCGVNAFYLAPVHVKGVVVQEGLFTNLSYQYSRTNYPIYAAAKAVFHYGSIYDATVNLGIGPNIVSCGSFQEKSIHGADSVPNSRMFSRKTIAVFSAAAGFGWRFNIVKHFTLECNYQFFYLGNGKLQKGNNQVKNNLHTGNSYGNALFLSIFL